MSLTQSPAEFQVPHTAATVAPRESMRTALEAPTELHPLDHIVAGHTVQGKDAMLGADGLLYKPVQKGEKGQREVNFYEQVETVCPQLRSFLPAYFGTIQRGNMRYLALEDFAIRFREPCVIDLKIGVRTYEPDASPAKVETELRKCPHQAQVGFRPCGMRVYGTRTGQYRCRNKDWGKAVTPATATSLLAEFVCDDDATRSVRRIRRVVPPLLLRLRALAERLQSLEGLRFFASSVILVYEGNEDRSCAEVPDSAAGVDAPLGAPGARTASGVAGAADAAVNAGAGAGPGAPGGTEDAEVDLRMVDFAHWVSAALVPGKLLALVPPRHISLEGWPVGWVRVSPCRDAHPYHAVTPLAVGGAFLFAQVRTEGGMDDNCLTGLRNAIARLESILAAAPEWATRLEASLPRPQFDCASVPPLSRDPSSGGEDAEGDEPESGETLSVTGTASGEARGTPVFKRLKSVCSDA